VSTPLANEIRCSNSSSLIARACAVNVSTSPRPACRFGPLAHSMPAAPRSSVYLVPLLALLKRVACSLAQMWQNARAARSKCARSPRGRQADTLPRCHANAYVCAGTQVRVLASGGAAIELRSTTIVCTLIQCN
jgi:hypothetical protein